MVGMLGPFEIFGITGIAGGGPIAEFGETDLFNKP
jgi:hypothetical protein